MKKELDTIPPTEKTCSKCGGEPQPIDEFGKSKRSKDGRQSHCKTCMNAYYQANKEKIIAKVMANRNKPIAISSGRTYDRIRSLLSQRNTKRV